MNLDALKTIKRQNSKWTIAKCKKHAQSVINMISKEFPDGIDTEHYFVVPGFEHVTKDQPIITFDPTEGQWELNINTKFKI